MIVQPVITAPITEAVQVAFAVGVQRAQAFEGEYHKEVLEINGVVVIVDVRKDVAFVIITGTPTGFLLKPRLVSEDSYLNQDTDGKTIIMASEDGSPWEVDPTLPLTSASTILYGNIDWKGTVEDDSAQILSWKGPPARYFPLDIRTYYDGLVVFDEEITEYIGGAPIQVPVYTCFGPNIYETGNILTTAPQIGVTTPKVLGAAYYNGTTLITILGTNYRDVTNPTGGTGGFWYEVYLADSWTRIGYKNSSRQTVPFFFNTDGTEASTIQDGILYTISITKKDNTFSAIFSSDGSLCTGGTKTRSKTSEYTTDGQAGEVWKNYANYPYDLEVVTSSKGTLAIDRSETCKVAVDYKGLTKVFATTVRTDAEKTELISRDTQTYYLLQNIPMEPPRALTASLYNLTVEGIITPGSTYAAGGGGCAPYTFTGYNCSVDSDGTILSVTCTPGELAIATVTVHSADGQTATAQGLVSGGGWYLVSQEDGCDGGSTFNTCYVYSGYTKTEWYSYVFAAYDDPPPCPLNPPCVPSLRYPYVWVIVYKRVFEWRCR